MHDNGRRSPARLLAPLALVVFAVALVVVIATSSVGGGGDDTDDADRGSPTAATTTARTETEAPRGPATYTVKTGDTLNAIADRTGLTVEEIEELNPELDPQALLAGQKIKLRE
jgi:LysM repeat protein